MSTEEVRSEIQKKFMELILGPLQEREVLSSNPSDTYLTGILWPAGSTLSAAEDDAGAIQVATADAESLDQAVPGYRSIRPCSIGLTFKVTPDVALEIDLQQTARYVPVERKASQRARPRLSPPVTDSQKAEDFDPIDEGDEESTRADRPKWERRPLGYRFYIDSRESRLEWRSNEFVGPDGSPVRDSDLYIDVRRRAQPDGVTFTITLINRASEPQSLHDAANLYQAGLRVQAVRKDKTHGILPRAMVEFVDDEDSLAHLLLYRDVREYAVGHGVATTWGQVDQQGAVMWVETEWLPRVPVKGMSPEGHALLNDLRRREPNPFAAATLAQENRHREACDALEEFCGVYGGWISATFDGITKLDADLRRAAEINRDRCLVALKRMRQGVANLRENKDVWTAFALANAAMDQQAQFAAKGESAKPLVWRPFQLGFILLVITSIADGSHDDRDTMDLLWFPTGGGKTEAYLALTAFAIFLGRVRNRARRDSPAVEVLMRYTLRLLTIQQFQRAAALITACDFVRATDESRLGTARISIGLYVGGDSTPNNLEDAKARLAEERNQGRPTSTPRQLLTCPVCAAPLGPSAYHIDTERRSMGIKCPGNQCASGGVLLPIMTVDEAIYEHPPSLVIGTVDKFAQLPRRTDIRRLFGLDTGLRPTLIIQDELHLISGPLGSMAGLYEAAIDMLCRDRQVRPKVIGSTATIGRAASQVKALFDRSVMQFPPPGLWAADSFFALRDEKGPDRAYVGVSTAGRSPKFALQAVLAALLQVPHVLRVGESAQDEDLDPYWTCVAYFNSLRELGGAHVMMLDDVPRQMQFIARRLGTTPRPLEGPPEELSGRKPSNEIPEVLRRLDARLGNLNLYAPQPVDTILASNMISVGVDVPRLGLMVVNGQPKSTAEYIQATSRVGRGVPGLVACLYNFGRPRDVSHFEHFVLYHSSLYRAVEATSVTPWAPRARDKALHAVLIASVRHLVGGLVNDEAAIEFDETCPEVSEIVDKLVRRANDSTNGFETEGTRRDLVAIVRRWAQRRSRSKTESRGLRYWEKRAPFGRTAPHLMRAAEETRSTGSDAWPTPNSLRDVEPSTAFLLKGTGSSSGAANDEA